MRKIFSIFFIACVIAGCSIPVSETISRPITEGYCLPEIDFIRYQTITPRYSDGTNGIVYLRERQVVDLMRPYLKENGFSLTEGPDARAVLLVDVKSYPVSIAEPAKVEPVSEYEPGQTVEYAGTYDDKSFSGVKTHSGRWKTHYIKTPGQVYPGLQIELELKLLNARSQEAVWYAKGMIETTDGYNVALGVLVDVLMKQYLPLRELP